MANIQTKISARPKCVHCGETCRGIMLNKSITLNFSSSQQHQQQKTFKRKEKVKKKQQQINQPNSSQRIFGLVLFLRVCVENENELGTITIGKLTLCALYFQTNLHDRIEM